MPRDEDSDPCSSGAGRVRRDEHGIEGIDVRVRARDPKPCAISPPSNGSRALPRGWAGCSTGWTCISTPWSRPPSSPSSWRSATPRDRARRLVQLADPGGVPARLGPGRRLLRTPWRPAGPEQGPEPDHPDLRAVHGAFVDRPDLVASPDLPVPRRPGDRRRMGRGGLAPVRDVAGPLAALDRGHAPERRQPGDPPGLGHHLPDGRLEPPRRLPRRHPARAAGVLDPPRGARARGMAPGPRGGRGRESPDPRPLPSRASAP